ncbi:Epsin-1, required for endocytosis and actin patch assembly [Datura stramonium]|uniref:Epsin-1, required for endocytosis and actin patch assembly n=1 Tax=Datura stramonium TaxID=4076 RepID=A0ABS8T6Z5_DATST|nr:Epsin-1, required for endocytosis and actin patch assembly [Datura stramonium]
MGATTVIGGDTESTSLLTSSSNPKIPKDTFHIAYIIYFTLGAGYLLPWNAFITAVDYFTYLYPDVMVDRIFAIAYMIVGLICLFFIVAFANKTSAFVRINIGLFLFVVALVTVPLIDVFYVDGRVGVYGAFVVTVGLVGLCGIADALVQGGVIGAAGELPERYMQATFAGTGASGVLVSLLRILTKAVYPQDAHGLRKSANLYFIFSIAIMILCVVFYNVANRLPVIKYYNDLKTQAVNEEKEEDKGDLTPELWRSTLDIVGRVKWYGFGILSIYVVTLCIFPGYITEDVHSQLLKDWYPILLITGFNVFDLVGKCLTPLLFLDNAKVAIGACFARLLFLPLFYGCLHGPKFFRTELPVTILTCLLGLTNGYLTSLLMMLGPKTVQLLHAEIAGTILVLFLVMGLAIGSVVSWFWII